MKAKRSLDARVFVRSQLDSAHESVLLSQELQQFIWEELGVRTVPSEAARSGSS